MVSLSRNAIIVLFVVVFLFAFLFVATTVVCGRSQARDPTCTIAVSRAAAVTTSDP